MAQNKAENKNRHIVSCTIIPYLFSLSLKYGKNKRIKGINEQKGQISKNHRGFYIVQTLFKEKCPSIYFQIVIINL